MPTPTIPTRQKTRPTPWPDKSLNFRMWLEGNKAPIVCQHCRKVVVTLTGQAVDLLPLLRGHRCTSEEPLHGS